MASDMRHMLRAKVLVPVVIVLVAVALTIGLTVRSHDAPRGAGSRHSRAAESTTDSHGSEEADVPGETKTSLEAWQRPATTDAKTFVIAYARAIWTYDTQLHTFWAWRDAVSVFADPADPPDGPRVARSMLPLSEQFHQLALHHGKASVSDITAEVTPELAALEKDLRAPAGWHAYLVRATQTSVLDGQISTAPRQATVAVVCTPRCKFWSASSQSPK